MTYGIIGAIVTLVGSVIFLVIKNNSLMSLFSNLDVKKTLNTIEGQISKNQGLIDASKEEMKEKENENVSKDNLTDFLNDPNHKP